MFNFCCYIYIDPRFEKLEPIYVGKGDQGRPYKHITKGATNIHLRRKLNKIMALNLTPEIIKIDVLTEQQAFMLERFWIKVIGRNDLKLGPLCNMTDGGEGASGLIQSKEAIESWKASYKKTKKTVSEEHKTILRNRRLGQKASQETIAAMKIAAKKRVESKEMRERISNALKGRSPGQRSIDTKKKMSESARKRSKEHYAKITASRLATLEKRKIDYSSYPCSECGCSHDGKHGQFCSNKCYRKNLKNRKM